MSWDIKYLERHLLVGSTLVEGSTLSEREAAEVLKGRTIQGHSVESHRELHNYRAAVVWLMAEFEESPYLSEQLIKSFHRQLFYGIAGQKSEWKSTKNFTYLSSGQKLTYLSPSLVSQAIGKWIVDFNAPLLSKQLKIVCETAAKLYYDFQFIHPFSDGNGRIGRILIAYWLHWKASYSFRFVLKDKIEHLEALEKANDGNFELLKKFFQKRLEN